MLSLLRSSGELHVPHLILLFNVFKMFKLILYVVVLVLKKKFELNPCYCLKRCRWKTLDGATLDLSSVSFFKEEKHEPAASKWTRARKRAAKVCHHFHKFYFVSLCLLLSQGVISFTISLC